MDKGSIWIFIFIGLFVGFFLYIVVESIVIESQLNNFCVNSGWDDYVSKNTLHYCQSYDGFATRQQITFKNINFFKCGIDDKVWFVKEAQNA